MGRAGTALRPTRIGSDAPALDACDAGRFPAHLVSTNERNLGSYRRLGFEVVAEVPVAGGAVTFRPDVAGAGRRGPMNQPGWRAAIFPALLVLFAAAYSWRITGVAPVEPVSAHLSNFYLTGAAVTLLSGRRAFVDRSRRGRALGVAALLAGVNLGAEVVLAAIGVDDEVNQAMGGVNTSDPLDGLAGLLGAGLVVALLPWRS